MNLQNSPHSRLKPFNRFEKAALCVLLAFLLMYAGALLSKSTLAIPDCEPAPDTQNYQFEKEVNALQLQVSMCRGDTKVKPA